MEFDAFLSYHGADKDQIRELRRRLIAQDLRVWLDEVDLRPGQSWQQGLEMGLRESRAVLVCLGESGIGSWGNEAMEAALARAVKDGQIVSRSCSRARPRTRLESPWAEDIRRWLAEHP